MNCREFTDSLEALIEGRLSSDQRRMVREHAERCDRCRELEFLVRQSLEIPAVATPPDLANSILERTSGSPCDRCRDLLCDFTDDSIDRIDDDLVRLHIESCDGCRGVALALQRLSEDLPAMARMSPGDEFVGDVMGSTVMRRPAPSPAEPPTPWWERWMKRPRVAWEMAYAGAFVLWLVFSLPVPAIQELPVRLVATVQRNPVEELKDPATQLGRRAWDATGARGLGSIRKVRDGLSERYARTGDARGNIRRRGSDLGAAVQDLDVQRSLDAVKGIGADTGTAWREFIGSENELNGARSDTGAG